MTELCSAEMERPLKLGQQVSLRTHLCFGCTHCRQRMKALRQVMQAYADGKAVTAESRLDAPE